MTTFTALTTLPGPGPAEALGAALEALEPAGVGVFEIEDGSGLWEVGAYFETAPDGPSLAILSAAFGAADFAVSEVPEIDWVAKVRRDLSPVVAGRFYVHGSHDADRVPPGVEALLIEAAMAFGTGHHATTKGCLVAIDALAAEGFVPARVADIGCGTAVLAMAAARVWPVAEVIAADIDAVAVEVAVANVAANGFAGRVPVMEAAGFDHEALAGPFDLVCANILMGPLIDLAPALAGALAPGGRAILSGLLDAQADAVAAAYARAGCEVVAARPLDGWTTLLLARN